MPELPKKPFLRAEELLPFFDVSLKTIYNWCGMGILESYTIGGVMRIKKESVIELLKERNTKNLPG